jgi:hypothetical protein
MLHRYGNGNELQSYKDAWISSTTGQLLASKGGLLYEVGCNMIMIFYSEPTQIPLQHFS